MAKMSDSTTTSSHPNVPHLISPLLRDGIAGAGGGVVCTLVCSPLDVVKTRLQIQTHIGIKKYSGLSGAFSTIWREEGVRGLYKGIEPSLITIPLFWAMYFPLYSKINSVLETTSLRERPAMQHCFSAIGAALISDCVSNPFWVVRTRMMAEIYHGDPTAEKHTFPAIAQLFRREGMRGMFKGLSASFLGVIHVAVQFPIYESMKESAAQRHPTQQLTKTDLLLCAGGSKFIASCVSYPHEVIRSRIQDWRGPGQVGLVDIIRATWRHEGLKGFYQGLGVNLTRVIPACITTFVSYEVIKNYLMTD